MVENNKASVLLVEDNPDDRELTMLAFEEAGLHGAVVACEDTPQALDQLRRWEAEEQPVPHRPNLVLLDIQLPGDDGFKILKALRSSPLTRFVPVVMLSSSAEESDIIKSYRLGANSYVRKPVVFERFVEVAHTFKRYWLTLNDVP